METGTLPEFNTVVLAQCQRADGTIEEHLIRRIKTKNTPEGWQWSHPKIQTYFTLKVISWKHVDL